ncbi:MAG: TRAP transporter substrate-binding protein DctP [Pseudomonadales bacterium]
MEPELKFRLLIVCTAIAILASISIDSAQARTFKIATISPDGLSWMKNLRAGAKEIEERTDGRVKFKIYPGGVQGDDYTVLRKMRIGQLHGGAVAASTLTRFYPDLQIYNLPLTFRSLAEVDYVRERMDQQIIKGLDDGGIVSFSLIETGFAYILTSRRVNDLDDLKNMKAWVPDGDPVSARLIQSFGISPIPLNITDVLAGLQTGLIDAVAVPPIVALALQWHNHVSYVVDLPLMYIYSMMMLDKTAFEKLSDADQLVVRDVMNRVFDQVDDENRTNNKAAFQALLNQGIELIEPVDDQVEAWRAQARISIEALVDAGQISPESLELLRHYLAQTRQGDHDKSSASAE